MYEAEELVGKTYHIKTFGCQMNLHDSERVRGLLDVCGCNEVESTDDADIVIFMTCSVRENADQRLYGQASAMVSAPRLRRESALLPLADALRNVTEKRLKRKFPQLTWFLEPALLQVFLHF